MPYFPRLAPATEIIDFTKLDAASLLWHANYCASEINNYQHDLITADTDALDHRAYQNAVADLQRIAVAYAARKITLALRPLDCKIMLLHNTEN